MPSLGPLTIPSIPQQNDIAIDNEHCTKTSQELIDTNAIDPYVHTMQRCADDLSGVARQQRCVMCIKEKRRTSTTFYCSLCCVTAVQEEERRPAKHAYCINPKYNCFARHIAMCYRHMNVTGRMMTSRMNQPNEERAADYAQHGVIPITGRVVSRRIPRRRQSTRNRT